MERFQLESGQRARPAERARALVALIAALTLLAAAAISVGVVFAADAPQAPTPAPADPAPAEPAPTEPAPAEPATPEPAPAETDEDAAEPTPQAMPQPDITFCHASASGGYSLVTLPASSVINGHGHHDGDVIPPFSYTLPNGTTSSYPGQNLGPLPGGYTGLELLANGCVPPEQPGRPPVEPITPEVPVDPGDPVDRPTEPITPEVPVIPDCTDDEVAWQFEDGVRCVQLPDVRPIAPPQRPEPPEPGALTPVVECVTEGTPNVAWFGYVNTVSEPVTVPVGADNSVTPSGTPPTVFGPGTARFVFRVDTTATSASWTLQGTTVTADAGSPRCSDDGGGDPVDPVDPVEPVDPNQPDIEVPVLPPVDPCGLGSRTTDAGCAKVKPIELGLVDNVLDCDGTAVAVFAASNPNDVPIDRETAVSRLMPNGGTDAPEVIDAHLNRAADRVLSGVVAVRYTTAVTWQVWHDGYNLSASAGVATARRLADGCTEDLREAVLGESDPPFVLLPLTGMPLTLLALVGTFLVGAGASLWAVAARRT